MRVCIFCSSRNQIAESSQKEAFELAKRLAQEGIPLVFGGSTGGLMTSIAEGAASEGGEIIGVILDYFLKNRCSKLLTETIVCRTLSERKRIMNALSDIFVVLPGGYGTLDEMFDIIGSATVGEHRKAIILVNENGFYDLLIAQIDKMKLENYIPEQGNFKLTIANNAAHCADIIHEMKLQIT
jgi:uncharacterized protein (TIGR00730 family)